MLTTEPVAVLVVSTFCVVGIGVEEAGFGAAVTTGFAGADTVGCVGGAVTTGVYGITDSPEIAFAETTVIHTGLPERAESIVTLTGRPPETDAGDTSTWMRTRPDASVLRVIRLNGINVFPTEPKMATYEGSETVNSKE